MVLIAEEITVVGHRCTINGRLPETDRVGVIDRWPACGNITDVRMFLGTIGVCRVFIRDFAKLAGPLNHLLRKNVPFVWGPEQEQSMMDLKAALKEAVPLGNIDYESEGTVVLAIDTSYKAVGFYIYQESVDDTKKKMFVKFGSITLNAREARFSQPKRELFGLKRALEASEYLLIGCWKLVVETVIRLSVAGREQQLNKMRICVYGVSTDDSTKSSETETGNTVRTTQENGSKTGRHLYSSSPMCTEVVRIDTGRSVSFARRMK